MTRSATLAILLSLGMALVLPHVARAAACQPSFPLETGKPLGWQGADAAYSIPLPHGRVLWIFGDTLYGPGRSVDGDQPRMVRNSLGLSTCAGSQWHLDYVIRKDAQGQPASFFSPANPDHWYWPLDGFYAKGDLWVTLLCIRRPSKPAPAGFDFETCGSDLAQLSGLNKDPLQWKVTIRTLVPDGVKAYPSATTLVHQGYAYLFAQSESGSHPLLVTRMPIGKLTAPAANLEYLNVDGTWRLGFDPAQAKHVMAQGASELSIRYHPELKQWLAVMIDPSFFSEKILLRTASTLAGPWSEGTVLYRIPEMLPGPTRDNDTFCYAAKEHPEFETGSNIVFTYVCNTMSPSKLPLLHQIYFPQVIRQPMPVFTQPGSSATPSRH